MDEWVDPDDAVMVYQPSGLSGEADLAFVESMLQSAKIPYSVTGEQEGAHFGRPQLYVAKHDVDDTCQLLADLHKNGLNEWIDPEDRLDLEVPSVSSLPPLEQPQEPESSFASSSLSGHVFKVILFVVAVFAAITALIYFASR
ncbi:MAG: hypothetical protein FWF45_07930 [Coriobacteriia bacterium]|nr:hypothetical protein [Coriobacteriia bacterium]